MKKRPHLLSLFLGALLGPAALSGQTLMIGTAGVYDENAVQANSVNVSATSTAGNRLSLADFSAQVAAAFSSNLGGVIQFDSVPAGGPFTEIAASYGLSQGQTLIISNGFAPWSISDSLTNRTPISGGQYLSTTGVDSGGRFVFQFAPASQVIAVGATLLSRSGSSDIEFTAQVTFSDLSTESVTFLSSGSSNAGNDTFAGFKAPDGLVITEFSFLNNPLNLYRSMDDLGFVVAIPEPSSFVLMLGLAVLLLAGLRRLRA